MLKTPISILIPTWNNPQYFDPCVESIARTGVLNGLASLIVVNNGKQNIKEKLKDWPNTLVLEPGSNLGWERGLEFGLKHTESPFVVFQNDDTLIPIACANFYQQMLSRFNDDNVAAVGPATTVAAGWHSVHSRNPLIQVVDVSYLIFFTVMMRRAHYDLAGGIDTSCPGGDDIDLSIRLRKLGKKLVVNPYSFLIHYGFKTGERVRGDSNTANGWNSKEMTDRTNQWLIQKHGFSTFMKTMRGDISRDVAYSTPDTEGNVIREIVGDEVVYELGCGGQKTVKQAIGVDRVPKGELIPYVGVISEADIVVDVTGKLPVDDLTADTLICRHILEHIQNSVIALKEWRRILKVGGRLIIAVPNENIGKGIPMNPEHCASYTPESLKDLVELLGFKQIATIDPKNGVSFVSVFQKTSCVLSNESSCAEIGSKIKQGSLDGCHV